MNLVREVQAQAIMDLPFDDPALVAAKARVDTLTAQAAAAITKTASPAQP